MQTGAHPKMDCKNFLNSILFLCSRGLPAKPLQCIESGAGRFDNP